MTHCFINFRTVRCTIASYLVDCRLTYHLFCCVFKMFINGVKFEMKTVVLCLLPTVLNVFEGKVFSAI